MEVKINQTMRSESSRIEERYSVEGAEVFELSYSRGRKFLPEHLYVTIKTYIDKDGKPVTTTSARVVGRVLKKDGKPGKNIGDVAFYDINHEQYQKEMPPWLLPFLRSLNLVD